MCGICGIFGKHDRKVIGSMTASLTHRGPDDFGYYYHRDLISLGHRRLSIIDLESGRQPIFNEDKKIAVVFNGEIYNYVELRPELEKRGHTFVTNTDTEVILHLYEEYGEEFIHKMNGEWAIALFDSRSETLYLYRDRFGIRSVYYARNEDQIVFGSEIKALFASGLIGKELDAEALNYFMTLRYVPGRASLFAGITKLPPGHYLKMTRDNTEEKRYYAVEYSETATAKPGALVEEFGSLLEDSVRIRMRSDVPVGAFLSGGIDSSVIVALARKFTGDMNTYSIGFRSAIDENQQARETSRHLGTNHDDIYVDENDFTEIESIVRRMDEPIGDFILLPTYLLNKRAARDVKVVLTGEGADEILGGYLHHLALSKMWIGGGLLAGALSRGVSRGINAFTPDFLDRFFPYPAFLGKAGKAKLTSLLDNLQSFLPSYLSFAGFFSAKEREESLGASYYRDLLFQHVLDRCPIERNRRFSLNTIIDVDMNGWLPDYTLLKQDRLSMMNSIEGRVPYLDHRLVEFSARLPANMKNRGMTTKYILRESAKSVLPKEVINRKKAAFYIPTEKVFAPGYRDFVMERLLDGKLARDGIFKRESLEALASHYGSKEIIENKRLNNILILAMWYEGCL